jgi:hypothetical protein
MRRPVAHLELRLRRGSQRGRTLGRTTPSRGHSAKIGALAAVIAIPVAIVLAVIGGADNPQPTASGTASGPDRASTVPSARIEARIAASNTMVPVAAADLPTPPAYVPDGPETQESHCEEWGAWLQEQKGAPLAPPSLSVSAPAAAAASKRSGRRSLRFAPSPASRRSARSTLTCARAGGPRGRTSKRTELTPGRSRFPRTLLVRRRLRLLGRVEAASVLAKPALAAAERLTTRLQPLGGLRDRGLGLSTTGSSTDRPAREPRRAA